MEERAAHGARTEAADLASARVLLVLELLGIALEQRSHRAAAAAVATELAVRLDLERASFGSLRRGHAKVDAISHSATFDDRQGLVRDLAAAMEEAADQDLTLVLPELPDSPTAVTRAHESLATRRGAGFVCSVPLAHEGSVVGVLTLEGRAGRAIAPALIRVAEDVAALLGPVLELRRLSTSGWPTRLRAGVTESVQRVVGKDHPVHRAVAVAVVVLLGIVTLVPMTYRVAADATLEGRVQRAVVAGLDGFISESHARAGDVVAQGAVLGRLDERDLVLEKRKGVAGREQLQRERRQAMADHDRSRISIAQAKLEQADAQLELIEELHARTRLLAPFDGVVVQGDLSRALGSPVKKGDVLFQVTPLDGYKVILEVDERDIAAVESGSRGVLTLSALPGERLAFAVERVTPVAIAEDGKTYFRAEARLEQPSASLRPGMAGVAKIESGKRRLVWIWTHDLLDWVRLQAWALWA